jgi:hypothetical protein
LLRHALKEWAVICKLLAEGRQTILLRKGGIAEAGGAFRLEHGAFWLYPTYVHQQRDGVRPELLPVLNAAQQGQPRTGVVQFTHFATAPFAFQVDRVEQLMGLQDLHGWSDETVHSRFAYRRPGLFVIPVRVYCAAKTSELPETGEYAGCKSWVKLATELSTDNATPVLDDATVARVVERLNRSLRSA